ncbi:hypothetical protein FG386_003687 [Cryptosporidium ryanae]|uniref:uncharacterized protein n=1 Tax=Cryptosporidium ryanae TaxID=515981 RepID=UPI003519DF13|nr:hypothetical protein FG386_003687 [Cryptosporidium ryanae]
MKLFKGKIKNRLCKYVRVLSQKNFKSNIPYKIDDLKKNEGQYYQERTMKEIDESEAGTTNVNIVKKLNFNVKNEILDLKTFKFNEGNGESELEITPKNMVRNDIYSENSTPSSSLLFLETSVGSGRNSFTGETPQTSESICYNCDKYESINGNNELEFDINKLEELYEEVNIYIENNYPYYAYSKYLELSMILFSVLSKYGLDKTIYLEMSLLIYSNNFLNLNLSNISTLDECYSSNSINTKNTNNPLYRNAKHSTARCSPIIISPFHSSLKGLKLSSSKILSNSTSEINTSDNNDKKNQNSKQLIYLDLIYLNRNGVPIKNNPNNVINGSNSIMQGSSGITRKLKSKFTSIVELSNFGSLGNNNNIKKGKIFAESFPLLETNNENELKIQKKEIKNNLNDISSSKNSKIFSLDEFPCIIFSNNCFPVFSNKFSSVKNRNCSINYIKFPTEVNCIIEKTELSKNYEKKNEVERLRSFIVKLVTNMNIHRLRFSLYKCSSSYMDLVSALKMKKKNHSKYEMENKVKDKNINSTINQRECTNNNSKSEWNSFGDSNMGMWWAMRSESEFLILCDCIVNTCPLNVLSIVNESDLHLHWAPFVNNSECLSYIGLYNQIVRHSSNMPWPIGLCQCSLYCVAIDAHRGNDLSEEPFIIITAVSIPDKCDTVCGIKVKDTQIEASKLDILSLCFVIQSVPNSPMQTRISFLSKSIIPIPNFVPKAVPSFIAKQIGKSFYNNIINIIDKFNGSPFHYRLNTDFEFYGFIAKRLKINYNTFGNETGSEDEMQDILEHENNVFYLENNNIDLKNQNQDISPNIRKRRIKNDLKQKEEMDEFSKVNNFYEVNKKLVDKNHSKTNISIDKPTTIYFPDNIHKKLGSMFPSI